MRVMLDSDAYSEFMRGNSRVGDIVRSAEEIVMPAVVVAELMYAFRQGQRTEQHGDQLRSFLDRPYVSFMPAGPVTADRYARIMDSLRTRGIHVPTNRVWVAAHAMETGAGLLSADRHYGHIEQIAWVSVGPDRGQPGPAGG